MTDSEVAAIANDPIVDEWYGDEIHCYYPPKTEEEEYASDSIS